jgi:hypothetical protein
MNHSTLNNVRADSASLARDLNAHLNQDGIKSWHKLKVIEGGDIDNKSLTNVVEELEKKVRKGEVPKELLDGAERLKQLDSRLDKVKASGNKTFSNEVESGDDISEKTLVNSLLNGARKDLRSAGV